MKCDRFRWVVCQLDTLRRCVSWEIHKALGELPITLDETYERTLQEIPREKKEHTHRLFQCLTSAIRPLRVEELGTILTINFDTNPTLNLVEGPRPEHPEEEILCACSTLIAVVDDGNFKIVQFSHFSVKEFLTSDRLRTSDVESIRHYYVPLHAAHTFLARACLAMLLQLDERIDKNRLSMFPLASYAAQHWVDHAQFEDVAPQIADIMELLFNPKKPYLAAWTGIHNIDSPRVPQSIGALADLPSPPETTALYYAALCGFAGLAEHLIIMHAEDVNAICGRHGTPLHVAAYMGHVDAARVLLDHGADVDTNVFGETPLVSAYLTGHLDVMQLLLKCGANPAVENYDAGWLIFHHASSRGKIDVVRLLLCYNASVNSKDWRKSTPLHCASSGGHGELVKLLLEHGANVNARDDRNLAPLHWASTVGNAEVVKHLLTHGADVDATDDTNSMPLHWASTDGHVEVVKLLLGYGADVHARDNSDLMPLHQASRIGHVEAVKLLLEHGAHVNIRDSTTWTPLQYAIKDGHLGIIGPLLEYGADINSRDDTNSTPMHWASRGGFLEAIELLLQYQADVNASDDTNLTPLHWASRYGHLEVVDLLLEHNADVNACSMDHGTPLCLASREGYLEIVRLLLAYGADVHIWGEDSLTGFQMATVYGHIEVAELLLEYGAERD